MITQVIDYFPERQLGNAAQLLAAGQLVAFPTETVYGLGANALDAAAVRQIYQVKGRPSDNPLIVHIGASEQAGELAEVTPLARRLMRAFWPGPLTLVLPARPGLLPPETTGGLPTVGLRMPAHPAALQLLQEAGLPVAAPSANLSGRPSPTGAEHVFHDLQDKIPLIINGGECLAGLESTVLDLASEVPAILRPGVITAADLADLLPGLPEQTKLPSGAVAKAPGMKYRHYAPKARVLLCAAEQIYPTYRRCYQQLLNEGVEQPRIAVLASMQGLSGLAAAEHCFLLGENLAQVAQNLFAALRWTDEIQADLVLAEAFPEQGLGIAIMNRLNKAAARK